MTYKLKSSELTPLSRVFLYRCIVVEALASISGYMAILSKDQEQLVEQQLMRFSDFVDGLIDNKEDEKEITLKVDNNDYEVSVSKKDLFEIRQLLSLRTKTYASHEFISSLKILGLFWVLVSKHVGVLVDGKSIDLEILDVAKQRNIFDERTIWSLSHLLPALDKQINYFHILFDENPPTKNILQNDVWLKYVELQSCLIKMNPAKRKAASIYSYQVQNFKGEAKGLLEYGWFFWRKRKSFNTKQIYLSGNPASLDHDIRRPIIFDLAQPQNGATQVSSVLAPIGRFIELPFKKKAERYFGVSKFMYKHKNVITASKIGFALACGLGIYLASEINIASIAGSSNPILTGFFTITSTVSVFVITTIGEKFVKNNFPEDNDLVIKDKKKQ
jgi:hypothetical protein